MGQGSLSSELIMCGGGVRSILLLPLVTRWQETIDVCILAHVCFMSVVEAHIIYNTRNIF